MIRLDWDIRWHETEALPEGGVCWTCPNCGSDGRDHETDGGDPRSAQTGRLCVRRVPVTETSFDEEIARESAAYNAADGTALCGMQWEPMDYTREGDLA